MILWKYLLTCNGVFFLFIATCTESPLSLVYQLYRNKTKSLIEMTYLEYLEIMEFLSLKRNECLRVFLIVFSCISGLRNS